MTEDDAIAIINRWCGELSTRSATVRRSTIDGRSLWVVDLWRLNGHGRVVSASASDEHAGMAAAKAIEKAAKVRRAG